MSSPLPAADRGPPVPTWLPVLALSLAALCLPGLAPRLAFDGVDKTLELVVDYRQLRDQARPFGVDRPTLLSHLAEVGITAVAVRPQSLRDLVDGGDLTRLTGTAQRRTYRVAAGIQAAELAAALAPFTPAHAEGRDLVVPGGGDLVEDLRVYLPPRLLPDIAAAGLRPVVRLRNSGFRADYPTHASRLAPEGSLVIFEDKEALGYPALLDRAARAMAARGLQVGEVEFAGQRGVESLAKLGGLPSHLVHSISDEEMAKYPMSRVLPRWVRAVRERRVRVLYLNAFPPENLPIAAKTGIEANLLYFERVAAALAKIGFSPGRPADPGRQLPLPWPLWRLLACLAAATSGAWLLAFYRVLPPSWLATAALAAGALAAAAGGARGGGLAANLLALTAACTAPAAAVLAGLESSRGEASSLWATFRTLVVVFVASAAAGVVIFVLLSHPGYLTRALRFRGVKLVYVGPLALIAAYHLRRVPWHHRPLKLVECGLLGIGLVLGAVYLMRSGNFSAVPASAAEVRLRDQLEARLPYRPRTKEVAFGYPALGLMAGAAARGDAFWAGWAGLGGAVAGVSATNSFCHIKTPFLSSLGRGGVGLLCGLPLAFLAALLHRLFLQRRDRKTWVLAGYAGFGNFGDDWITAAALAELDRRRPPDTDLVLLAPDPAAARARFGVAAVGRTDVLQIAFVLRHADVFATGPGGLIQDRTSWRSPLYYLGLHGLARLIGVPKVAFLGEGFGPLKRSWLRGATEFYAAAADLCLVRDPGSAAYAPGAVAAADASLWPALPPPRSRPAPARGPLGVTLREPPGGEFADLEPLADALTQLVRDRGLDRVRLLPAHPGHDKLLHQRLRRRLEESEVPVEVTPLAELEPADLRALSGLVSMRLHGCFLAWIHQVPLLAVRYDPKVSRAVEAAGHPFHIAPEADVGQWKERLGALYEDPEAVSAASSASRAALAGGRPAAHAALDAFFGAPRREAAPALEAAAVPEIAAIPDVATAPEPESATDETAPPEVAGEAPDPDPAPDAPPEAADRPPAVPPETKVMATSEGPEP